MSEADVEDDLLPWLILVVCSLFLFWASPPTPVLSLPRIRLSGDARQPEKSACYGKSWQALCSRLGGHLGRNFLLCVVTLIFSMPVL